MIVICNVNSGMCNRLFPFLTSYYFSIKNNFDYYLYWDENCQDLEYKYVGDKTSYSDLFQNIENIKYINNEKYISLISNNKKIFEVKYNEKSKIKDIDLNNLKEFDIILFNHYVHPIFFNNLTSYSNVNHNLLNDINNNDITILHDLFKLVKPNVKILNRINKYDNIFLKYKVIGIHIRHRNNIWNNNYNFVKKKRNLLIKFFINKNNNYKFFISTTNLNELNYLLKLFPNNIIYFKERFGNDKNEHFYLNDTNLDFCNKNKNLNGVVDLFLLSKCNIIFSELSSSFSMASKFLNFKNRIYFI
jgi:hypothetical protein